jgi:hypothetical protein
MHHRITFFGSFASSSTYKPMLYACARVGLGLMLVQPNVISDYRPQVTGHF